MSKVAFHGYEGLSPHPAGPNNFLSTYYDESETTRYLSVLARCLRTRAM